MTKRLNVLLLKWIGIVGFVLLLNGNALGQEVLFMEDFSNKPEVQWKQIIAIGDKNIDSFRFNAPNYIPMSPIENGFAFFDVYQAGERKASNGNKLQEKVYLISPIIAGTFSGQSNVSFDYQLIKLRSAALSLELSSDSGSNWTTIWSDSMGSPMTKKIDLRIDHLLSKTPKVQCRFLWQTKDTMLHQGYVFIDNFKVSNIKNKDVAIVRGKHMVDTLCNETGELDGYVVDNVGLNDLDSIITGVTVFHKGFLVDSHSDTFFNLKANTSQIGKLIKSVFSESGTYTIVIRQSIKDDYEANDTLIRKVWIRDTLKKPVTANVMRCGSGNVRLAALNNTDSIFWYDKYGKVLHSGSGFSTPDLQKTDTFYAGSIHLEPRTLSTFQGPYRFNSYVTGGSYMELTAKNSIRITALSQHFATSGDTCLAKVFVRNGSLSNHRTDTSGWVLHHTATIVTSSWGLYQQMKIPAIYMNADDTISFYIAFEGKAQFSFKKGALNLKSQDVNILCDGVNDKQFSQGGALYQNYSWDGLLYYESYCASQLSQALAFISPRPKGAYLAAGQSFSGVVRDGSKAKPDEANLNHVAVYDIFPPKGHLPGAYGSTWGINQISFSTAQYGDITSKVSYNLKTGSGLVQLHLTVDSSLVELIITAHVIVKDYSLNCDTVVARSFRLSAPPIAMFAFDAPCLGSVVNFKNLSKGNPVESTEWDFDDGSKDVNYSSQHAFKKNKTYYVRLVVRNKFGVADTALLPVTVNIYAKSSIRAIHTCLGTPAELQNISTNASLIQAYYLWIYNGDTIHAAPDYKSFTHSFPSSGIHKVKLISNHQGCIDSTTKNVFQFENPVAGYQYQGDCQYDTFSINNLSSIKGQDKLGYRWLMNGATFNTQEHPRGVHTSYGIKEITLIVTSEFNCRDTIAKLFEIKPGVKARFQVGLACKNDSTKFLNTSINDAAIAVNYTWNFGDGEKGYQLHEKHFYSEVGEKTVRLESAAANGCRTYFDTTLVVRVNPIAQFEVDDVCAEEEAIFLNKSKLENKILYYQWSFGDGGISNIHSPKHVYKSNESAIYVVRLKVHTANDLCTDEFVTTINVFEKPSCAFGFEILKDDSLGYRFFANDTSLVEYTWSFGGGGISNQASPQHTFQDGQTYSVRLYGKNKYGCFCTQEQQITPGVSHVSLNKLVVVKAYPNPFTNHINIQLAHSVDCEIYLTDNLGRNLTFERHIKGDNLIQILPSKSAKGVIFLHVITEGGHTATPVLRL